VLICLRDLPVGQRAKLVYMSSSSHKRLDQLTSVGLLPGVIVQLHQRRPAFVIDVGQSSLALDEEIVSGIYVRPIG
jgi:DtxR family Mn-dependent transcriptional regulator